MKTGKAVTGVLVSFGLLASLATLAAADTLTADGDVLVNSPNISIDTEAECDALPHTYNGNMQLSWAGNTHYNNGSTVTVSSDPDADAVDAGITVGADATWVVAAWDGNTDVHDFAASATVPAGIDDGSYKVDVKSSGVGTLVQGPNQTAVNPYEVTSQYVISVACDQFDDVTPPGNQAPSVDAGGPYTGAEGSAIALDGGSFTDTDGPTTPAATYAWSIDGTPSVAPGACSLGGDTSSLSGATLTCTDNGSATVKLTVTDGAGAAGSDTASVTIDNANPVVGAVAVTQTGACSVSVSATFTDAGSADTHPSGSVAWGDSTTNSSPTIGSGTISGGSHTYSTSGEKTITVSVTDDDGGVGSNTGSFTTELAVGAFGAPINTGSGPRSVFKLGSTIPVKVVVKDCAGTVVSTASPTVNLVKLDSVPDGAVNEQTITETPTNGKLMRWDGTQYLYNLSTKNSQFSVNGGALTSGSYKLWVSGAGIYPGAPAYFDLK